METQDTISKWAIETFGTPTSTDIIFDRCMDEVEELNDKVMDFAPNDVIQSECADVLIVLYQFCQELGFNLQEAVDKKMAINRARKWETKGDGVGQHVKE